MTHYQQWYHSISGYAELKGFRALIRSIDLDEIIEVIEGASKPLGLGKIVFALFGYDSGKHVALQFALDTLVEQGEILRVPWYSGFGYVINREVTRMQYVVSAKVPKKDGKRDGNFIETDLKPRAIHLANVFRNNGWDDVKIECMGQEYRAPFGDLP